MSNQLRALARHVADEAVGGFLQRRPVQEMRVGLEGRPVIVEEILRRAARIDDQPVAPGTLQGPVGQAHHVLQVRGKQRIDGVGHGKGPGVEIRR
jgi:hypothetical protein